MPAPFLPLVLVPGSRPWRRLRRLAALRVGRAALAAGAPVPPAVLLALSCPTLAALQATAAPCGRTACPCSPLEPAPGTPPAGHADPAEGLAIQPPLL